MATGGLSVITSTHKMESDAETFTLRPKRPPPPPPPTVRIEPKPISSQRTKGILSLSLPSVLSLSS